MRRPKRSETSFAEGTFVDLAGLFAADSRWETAVRLYAAPDALRRSLCNVPTFAERRTGDRFISEAREALGEERFSAHWLAGQTMTLDAAVSYALDEIEAAFAIRAR